MASTFPQQCRPPTSATRLSRLAPRAINNLGLRYSFHFGPVYRFDTETFDLALGPLRTTYHRLFLRPANCGLREIPKRFRWELSDISYCLGPLTACKAGSFSSFGSTDHPVHYQPQTCSFVSLLGVPNVNQVDWWPISVPRAFGSARSGYSVVISAPFSSCI